MPRKALNGLDGDGDGAQMTAHGAMRLQELRPETSFAIAVIEQSLVLARNGPGDIHVKLGRDVVTDADYAVEDFIRREIDNRFGIHVIGEERGGWPTSMEPYWLVDPICGTRNFASGMTLFSINMALVEEQRVKVAVVGDGSTGRIHFAERGRGAWVNDDETHVRLTSSADSQIVNMDGWPPASTERDRAARFAAAVIRLNRWDVRCLSTSLALVYLAAGRIAADIHFSTTPLHIGAGALLVSEAGATLTGRDGQEWTIESESLVASADEELHQELLHRLKVDF